jgi:hypothetical protein
MKILFVYNAEAGFLNGMMDSVHKIVSPSTYECALCAITHGAFSMDRRWRDYLRGLPVETSFFHRKDFAEAYPAATDALPAILLDREGVISPLISAEAFKGLETVDSLVAALNTALAREGVTS